MYLEVKPTFSFLIRISIANFNQTRDLVFPTRFLCIRWRKTVFLRFWKFV